jgi:hypothetical protein
MRLFDRFKRGPTGLFALNVFRDDEIIERYEDKNLVVIGSQQAHAKLLGGSVAGQSVTQFGVGTNATAPVFGNTTLTGQYANAITGVTYPATNQVQFSFSLGAADAAAYGMAISEFGLLTEIGALYARKVRSTPLNFASDISLTGSWTISF